jgi:glycine dehydrogenase subunit 1
MDVSNSSHYDGATSAAEACVLAYHHFRGKRTKFVLSRYLHPQYRETIRTYFQGYDDIRITGDQTEDGLQSNEDLLKQIDSDTAIVYVQYPDFLGRIQDFSAFAKQVHAVGAILAVSANPLAL